MFKRLTESLFGVKDRNTDKKDDENDFVIINGRVIYKKKEGENEENNTSQKKYENSPNAPTKKSFEANDNKALISRKEEIKEKSANTTTKNKNHSEISPSNTLEIEKEEKEIENNQSETVTKIRQGSHGRTRSIEGFYLTLKSAGRAKRTIETYRDCIKQWNKLAEMKGLDSIYGLKLKHIEEFLSKKDVSTAKKLLSSLRQLAKWYLRDGFNSLNNEVQKVMSIKGKERIPSAKEPEEFIRIRDEAKKMIEAGDRNGLWISLMLMCGLRISEIQTVEIFQKSIQVIGKGDKQRRIPAAAYLIEGLKNIPETGIGGYKQSRFVVDKQLRKLGYTHLHSLRHTYATYLINNGLRIEEIQNLLGHVNISTTQIYTKVQMREGLTDVLER